MADLELKTKSIDEDYKRFIALRRRVMQAIHRELELNDYCKFYEGTFEIFVSYPNYFDREYDNKPDEPDFYIIRLHCYVLGPGRHYEWRGSTLKNALDKAEKDINKWIREDDNGE